jgi:hypothetical protein
MEKQGGMAFGFRKTATAVIKRIDYYYYYCYNHLPSSLVSHVFGYLQL